MLYNENKYNIDVYNILMKILTALFLLLTVIEDEFTPPCYKRLNL